MADIDLKGWGRLDGEQVVVSADLNFASNPTFITQINAAKGAAVSIAGVVISNLTVKYVDGTLVGTDASETVTAEVAAIQVEEDERLVTINTPTSLDGPIRIYGWGIMGAPGVSNEAGGTVTPGDPGLLARYWNNENWTGQPVVTQVETIPYMARPSDGDLPPGVSGNPLGVRWTGKIVFPTTGAYRFRVNISDWGDVYIDNKLTVAVVNEAQGIRDSGTFNFTAGDEKVFWASLAEQGSRDRLFEFYWMLPGTTVWVQVPASAFKQADVTQPPQPVIPPQARTYVEYVNRYED